MKRSPSPHTAALPCSLRALLGVLSCLSVCCATTSYAQQHNSSTVTSGIPVDTVVRLSKAERRDQFNPYAAFGINRLYPQIDSLTNAKHWIIPTLYSVSGLVTQRGVLLMDWENASSSARLFPTLSVSEIGAKVHLRF